MDRKEFVTTLYNNGEGLTLDQIQTIENGLTDTIPDGVLEDIAREMGEDTTASGVIESALYLAMDNAMNDLHDANIDLLALREKLEELTGEKVSDQAVYHLSYVL